MVFEYFLPHQTKKKIKKKRYQSWTPSDETFWIRACKKSRKRRNLTDDDDDDDDYDDDDDDDDDHDDILNGFSLSLELRIK